MLAIVGLGSSFLFFIVLPFSAITILVSCFVTVTAGFGSAISEGRSIGFALAFRSTFVAFAFFGMGLVSGRRRSAVACPFSLSTTFAFLILVSPPSVIGGGGVVGHGRLGRGIDQFLDLEFRVTLETFMCEQFHHFVEGKSAFYVSFRTGGLDRVIGSFRDAVQEPVDTLFFGRGLRGSLCDICVMSFSNKSMCFVMLVP